MSAAGTGPRAERITRQDIESRFRALQGEVDEVADQAVSTALMAGLVVGATIVVLAFLVGRRRGRRKSAIIEVRRL